MSLPSGARVLARVGGGDINEAYHVALADGTEAFVKTRSGANPGEYETEAAALRWLAEPQALRVPRVIEVDASYLVLEWVQQGGISAAGEEELGRGLAAVHAAGSPVFGLSGHGGDARFGSLGLSNEPTEDWPSFYADRRLRPLTQLAAERGAISGRAVSALERICGRIGGLAGPPEPPARLHGDLWWGNVMADAGGHPWLIDPSAYGGHREVDLAMLRLFGGPSARVFAAYAESTPLAEGWRGRVELYQLAPLLVHAVLFGGSYGAAVERIAALYAS